VTSNGEVVGVNTAIISGAQGISFSVPIKTVEWVVSQILKQGSVQRGYIGMMAGARPAPPALQKLRALKFPSNTLLQVHDVEPGGPAHVAGLRPGDLVLALNGQTISCMDGLYSQMALHPPNTEVTLTVIRDMTSVHNFKVTLGSEADRRKNINRKSLPP